MSPTCAPVSMAARGGGAALLLAPFRKAKAAELMRPGLAAGEGG